MKEFLLNHYAFLTKLVELIAAIAGILVYKKFKHTVLKYFIWFLVYVFFVELIGGYTVYVYKYEALDHIEAALKGTLIERNYWWYSVFWTIGAPLFYATYFMTVIKTKVFKKILGWLRLVFFVTSISYILFNLDAYFTSTLKFNNISATFVILVSVVLYLIETLNSDRMLIFYKSANFYIAAINFIWFLVITPIVFYSHYFSKADWNFVFLKWEIYLTMNFFMYISFTFVLLCCKPQHLK
jgi:hypothetical protein